jgi:peptidoglycan/LPS O-acetylase OafA/YrhL
MPSLSAGFLPLLSRRTSGRALIPEIDGLRSVAIMSVVLFHAAGYFAAASNHGTDGTAIDAFLTRLLHVFDYGVPVFFVISGFILALPFAAHHLRGEKKPGLRTYFLRRLTRLEPPYIFALTVLLGLKLAGIVSTPGAEHGAAAPAELLKHYAASLFYVHNIVYGEMSTILGLAWSLEVEVQFYILAPLLTSIFAIRSAPLRRLILIIAIGVHSRLFGVDKPSDGLTILNHAPYFLAGMLLADLHLAGLDRGPRSANLWDLLAVLGIAGAFLAPAYGFAPSLTVPWFVLLAFASVFRAGPVRSFFRAAPVVILGGMCYSIYLWHSTAIGAARPVLLRITGADADWPTRLAFVLLGAIPAVAVSAVFFLLIERPTMIPQWPSKLWGRIRGGSPQAPAPS